METRVSKLLISSKKCRLPPFEIQILEASWKAGNNYFEDFYAFFRLVSDATQGLEGVEEATAQAKADCFPAFAG